MEQFQARQAVLTATPKHAGPAEREVRQLMPCDVLAPEPAKDAFDLRQFETGRGR